MNITIEHAYGIGINGIYHVFRDGKQVAYMQRSGRSTWIIYSLHYNERLASAGSIDLARARAMELNYPSAWEVYERLCERVAVRRKEELEAAHAHDLARLAREIINGSNFAHDELARLMHRIDTLTADRSDNGPRDSSGNWIKNYNRPHDYGIQLYPVPPAVKTEETHRPYGESYASP
jgi:hypothetical protein